MTTEQTTKPRRTWLKVVGAAAILTIGYGAGTTTQPAPPPPVETRVEVPGPTQTVTVSKTPTSCLDALEAGEKGFDIVAKILTANRDGFNALAEQDAEGLIAATAQLNKYNAELNNVAGPWNGAKAACRDLR
jgi:hypothetical protein